jgi:3'-phosphoadenosine 5'-phosphosulfate synthase
MNQSG